MGASKAVRGWPRTVALQCQRRARRRLSRRAFALLPFAVDADQQADSEGNRKAQQGVVGQFHRQIPAASIHWPSSWGVHAIVRKDIFPS